MYLDLIACPLSVGLVFGSPLAVALPLLRAGVFAWHVSDEEHLLRREFGEQWGPCCHTWRPVPYVY